MISKQETRGLVALAVVLAIVAALILLRQGQGDDEKPLTTRVRTNVTKPFAVQERKVETFPFDPNTADSTTLLRLGLPDYMVRAVYRYRAKGGVYSTPEDFARTYGMTKGMWRRLAPCITIGDDYQLMDPPPYPKRRAEARDTSGNRQLPPAPEVVRVAVNSADTAELRKIPGVGHYYASRIASYRERLGGFVSLAQLDEIDDLPLGVEQHMTLDTVPTRRMEVNKCSKRVLNSHPYLTADQAAAIWEHRRNHGSLTSFAPLLATGLFTPSDTLRLAPYVDFSR